MRKTLRRLALPLSLLCAGCAHTVTGPNARCSQLIPSTWSAGIEGIPLPDGDGIADWQKAFVGQSGQLEKANGRTADVISIIGTCETMVNASRR